MFELCQVKRTKNFNKFEIVSNKQGVLGTIYLPFGMELNEITLKVQS